MTHSAQDIDVHLQSARQATLEGRFEEARHHIEVAGTLGASHDVVQMTYGAVYDAQSLTSRSCGAYLYSAVSVAVLAYFSLSLTSPHQLTQAVWAPVALVVVPAFTGCLAGLSVMPGSSAGARFARGLGVAAVAVACYTLWNAFHARGALATPMSPGDVMGPILVVAACYAATAGLIAGACATLFHAKVRHS